MTLTRNRFLRIYKLEHGYLGTINLGNREYQFGLMTAKPLWFALFRKVSNGEYKTLIAIGD